MEIQSSKPRLKDPASLLAELQDQCGPMLLDMLRHVIELAFNSGREFQRVLMNDAIQNVLEHSIRIEELKEKLEEVKKEAHDHGVLLPGEYGATAQAVRVALNHFRTDKEDGASVDEIHRYVSKTLGFREVTVAQVRNTLKGLIKSREVVRPQRGVYAPGPRFPKKEAA